MNNGKFEISVSNCVNFGAFQKIFINFSSILIEWIFMQFFLKLRKNAGNGEKLNKTLIIII